MGMTLRPSPLSPDIWMTDMFRSKAACKGGVIRRSARDIERFVGRAAFEAEIRRRGFQAIENAGQVVVFCNREKIRRIV
tara:strand:+ start:295 stop:531 length:237 start_codon:yes stop_codon:yes gene_type:complete